MSEEIQNTNIDTELTQYLLSDLENKEKLFISSILNNNENKKFIPEKLFKEYFLPYFTGEKTLEKDILNTWSAIVGSPTQSINVVDDNDYNNILFEVPPIYNTDMVTHIPKDPFIREDNYYQTAVMYDQLLQSGIPGLSNNYLTDSLNNLLNNNNNKQYKEQWIKILERYGIVDSNKKIEKLSNFDDEIVIDF